MESGAPSNARLQSVSAFEPELHETVHAFARFLQTLPPSAFDPQRWGAREVLSHIVFWHEAYVRSISAQLERRPPPPLEGAFWQLNALAVARFQGTAVADLVNRLRRAQARLDRLAPEASRRRLLVVLKTGAKKRSVDELLAMVQAHIRGHQVALRRQLRRAG